MPADAPVVPPPPPSPAATGPDAKNPAAKAPAGPKVVPLSPDQLPLEGEDQPQEPGIHHGFFQQPWVQDILPLITSLAFHATIVIVGILAYSAYKHVINIKPN